MLGVTRRPRGCAARWSRRRRSRRWVRAPRAAGCRTPRTRRRTPASPCTCTTGARRARRSRARSRRRCTRSRRPGRTSRGQGRGGGGAARARGAASRTGVASLRSPPSSRGCDALAEDDAAVEPRPEPGACASLVDAFADELETHVFAEGPREMRGFLCVRLHRARPRLVTARGTEGARKRPSCDETSRAASSAENRFHAAREGGRRASLGLHV